MQRTILFLHVQRTGGMSLFHRLRTRFDESDCLIAAHGVAGARDPEGLGLIEGHVALGYARRFRRWPFIIAAFRDPIERAASMYQLLREETPAQQAWVAALYGPEKGARRQAMSERTRRFTLAQLLAQDDAEVVRFFGNNHARALSDPEPAPGEESLDAACAGLARCDVVLLTSRLVEAHEWLGERLGCGPLWPPVHFNSTTGRTRASELEPRVRDALAALTVLDRELYAIAVDEHERRLREWRAAGSPPEPSLDWAPPPSGRDYSFAQAVHGSGWQPRESDGDRHLCWIGAEREAWIDLAVDGKDDHDLRCEVAHVLRPELLERVTLRAGETPIALHRGATANGVELCGTVPAAEVAQGGGVLRLTFTVPGTVRPSDLDPASADHRPLGVAFSRIRIEPRPALRFSVIVPLEFHRGLTDECLRRWVSGQTFPRERYEVLVAACPASHPPGELEHVRSLLGPGDRLLELDQAHDIPLCAHAALAARGEALFFTEAHCLPATDALEVADRGLREHPDWAGFSGSSRPLVHNRLSVVEARFYGPDMRHGLEEHPWRKILDQVWIVRADAYRAAGGFRGELGHFAEWQLSAAMHHRGLPVGYLPEVEVEHRYCGDWRELVEFSADFAHGEMVFHARGDAEPTRGYFPPPVEWTQRLRWQRRLARAARTLSDRVGLPQADGSRRAALLGPRPLAAAADLRFALELVRLRLALLLGAGEERLLRRLVGLMDATVRRERAHFVRAWVDAADTAPSCAAVDALSWTAGEDPSILAFGLDEAESWEGQRFRWSAPVAVVEACLRPGRHRFAVRWLPVRPLQDLALWVDEQPLPVHFEGTEASAFVDVEEMQRVRLAWTCAPWQAPGDDRLLGLPLAELRIAPA